MWPHATHRHPRLETKGRARRGVGPAPPRADTRRDVTNFQQGICVLQEPAHHHVGHRCLLSRLRTCVIFSRPTNQSPRKRERRNGQLRSGHQVPTLHLGHAGGWSEPVSNQNRPSRLLHIHSSDPTLRHPHMPDTLDTMLPSALWKHQVPTHLPYKQQMALGWVRD